MKILKRSLCIVDICVRTWTVRSRWTYSQRLNHWITKVLLSLDDRQEQRDQI